MAVASCNEAAAADPAAASFASAKSSATSITLTSDQARQSVQWLLDLAVSKMPPTYEGDKNWGDTKKIWAGVKFKREGFEIKTHRRFREVRHGRWIQYRLKLPQPTAANASPVAAIVRDVRAMDEGVPGDVIPGWALDTELATPIEFDARIERWNLGVQLFSVNVIGRMDVRLNTSSTLAFYGDYSEIPPAFVIDPRVTAATLQLSDVKVDRVSKVGGEVAEQWGEMVEDLARNVFLPELNEKLPAKLNKSIAKNQDDLRFSLTDWLSNSSAK